ncbi:MAG TPA: hypothetical protein VFV38_04795, partial [Ktedonobacteraceae bacterium]|nr:hypothetical protein [Ktedonobacteraceae bacterium]
IPDPFTPASLSAGILTNIAANILEHYAQKLDGTLVGKMLKKAGLIEPNFNDRLRDTVGKALKLFFQTNPHYELTGILAFFQDPTVAQQLGAYILDRQPIDQGQLERALVRHLGNDGITRILLQRRGLTAELIIKDFLICYRQVLSEQLSVPQMGILLEICDQTATLIAEIRTSEERLKDFVATLFKTELSPQALSAAYQTGQQKVVLTLAQEMDAAGLIKPTQTQKTLEQRIHSLPALFTDGLCQGHPIHIAPQEYFVSHGFDSDTLSDWREILEETLMQSGSMSTLRPYFSGDSLLGGFRLCGICEKLFTTRFSIFLLPPSQDRNVYLELGIGIGLGVPFFLIQHHQATIPPILEGLSRYAKGGLFRTMRRELAGQIEEYDFGVVRFISQLPAAGSQPKYLIAAGEVVEDEDFEGSITEALAGPYAHLEAISLDKQPNDMGANWLLAEMVEAIQGARFAVYHVDDKCSPMTFLALGISIGLNRPFLMVRGPGGEVPLDLRGIGIYRYKNFGMLKREIEPKHHRFFDRYAR